MADGTAFFYGTLMVPKVLYRVIYGSTTPQPHQTQFLTIKPALLGSHRRHRVKNVDYPGVTPAADSSVLGTYVTGLTPQDLYRLDCFEGDEYERRTVKVNVLKGSVAKTQAEAVGGKEFGQADFLEGGEVSTQTYIFLDPRYLEPAEWDFEEFRKEKMAAWTLEASEEYDDIPYDNSDKDGVATQRDGTGGRGAGGNITKQLDQNTEANGSSVGAGSVARAAV